MPSPTRTYRGTPRNLTRLARRLRAGELVAVPTETVYGLAANALDSAACRRIYQAKGRPSRDPLIVHIHSIEQLAAVAMPNEAAFRLARRFWPGPLTLILAKRPAVPEVVSAGLPSVAVRMPSHALFRRLLRLAGVPLAAPSANPFGYVSPTSAAHVAAGLGGRIPSILDGGPSRIGLESTIIDIRRPRSPRLLRPGAITQAQLERALGVKVRVSQKKVADTAAQLAPGQLARHYSPHTPVSLHATLSAAAPHQAPREAWVYLARPKGRVGRNVFWLDARGRLDGVARQLFHMLRTLDARRFERIHIELAPGSGLADAINDRLRRAAAR